MLDLPNGGPVDPECVQAARERRRSARGPRPRRRRSFSARRLADPAGTGGDVDAHRRRARRRGRAVGAAPRDHDRRPRADAGGDGRSGAGRVSALDLVRAIDALATWSRKIAAAMADIDVLLSPTMAIPPPLLGTLSGDRPLEETLPGLGSDVGLRDPVRRHRPAGDLAAAALERRRAADRRAVRRRLRPRRPALPPRRPARAAPGPGRAGRPPI